jgi:transcriptional regulator with XRE-family HTH domain
LQLLHVSAETAHINAIEVNSPMLNHQLEALRIKADVSYKQLAQICDVSETTIGRIFSGETRDPGFSTVAAIVRACGGSLDDIAGIAHTDDPASLEAVRAIYEDRIAAIKEENRRREESTRADYLQRIDDITSSFERRQKEYIGQIRFIMILTAVLIIAIVIGIMKFLVSG